MIYSFPPIYDTRSRILILGSMASQESLRRGFYYMHPRNRFWTMMERITGDPVPESIEGKRQFLLDHHIAVMDSIYSCERQGSLDSNITDVVPNDIEQVLRVAPIRGVFCNGKKSYQVAKRAFPHIPIRCLPSTSPANAGNWSEDAWMELRRYLQDEQTQ